jgi:hypothetical protein
MHAERDLVVAVAATRHREGQVIEDAFTETLVEGEAMRRREIDPRLPLLGAAVRRGSYADRASAPSIIATAFASP